MRALALAIGLVFLAAAPAAARPTYFDALTARYGFAEGDRLFACGVCHYKWEGTGARNPFGASVQQQLYIGKSIQAALADVEGADADGDGFTNLEELTTGEGTLPGYSCANFFEAVGAPANHHSFITPLVPSCLEGHDIRLSTEQIAFVVQVGTPEVQRVEIFNNGIAEPVVVESYALDPGADPSLSLSGRAAPFSIPVGASEMLEVTFDPAQTTIENTNVSLVSDDPDEPVIEIGIFAIGVEENLASAPLRAACSREIDKHLRRYSKRHLKEWGRCYADEAAGVACRAGRRDAVLARAESKLRRAIGGAKDRSCAAAGLSPLVLGFDEFCGGGCGDIRLSDFGDVVSCLVCRQGEASDAMILETVGSAPPDRPSGVLEGAARSCQKKLLAAEQRAILKAQKALGRCEVANVDSATPVDCATELASELDSVRAAADAATGRCKDTTGMAGCHFVAEPDPACLGEAAVDIASEIVDAALGLTDE